MLDLIKNIEIQSSLDFFIKILPGILLLLFSVSSFAYSIYSEKKFQEQCKNSLSEFNDVKNDLINCNEDRFIKNQDDDFLGVLKNYHDLVKSSNMQINDVNILTAIGAYTYDRSKYLQNLNLDKDLVLSEYKNSIENLSLIEDSLQYLKLENDYRLNVVSLSNLNYVDKF